MTKQLVETYYILQVGSWFVTDNSPYGYGIHMSRTRCKRFMIRSFAESTKTIIKRLVKNSIKGGNDHMFPLVDPTLKVKLIKVNAYRKGKKSY